MTLTTDRAGLQERLAVVRGCLRAYSGLDPEAARAGPFAPTHDGLAAVVHACALSPFEHDVLVLVAGCELDAGLPALCAHAHGDPARPFVTFGLALSALAGGHWDALSPEGPLRGLVLIELDRRAGGGLTGARLTIDERVLLALLGLDTLDAQLNAVASAEPAVAAPLASRQAELLETAAARWLLDDARPLLLWGASVADRRAFERALARSVGAERLWRLEAASLPDHAADTVDLLGRLSREARMTGAPIVLSFDDADPVSLAVARRWADRLVASTPRVLLSSRDPIPGLPAQAITIDLPAATFEESVGLWRAALGPSAAALNGHVERLAGQFRLPSDQLRAAAADIGDVRDAPATLAGRLWLACRHRARADLDGLAERIEPAARWEDLVLPPRELAALRDLLRHTRHRATVYEDWLVSGSSRRAGGVSALFTGPSGTGKSLAAEVIATELDVDLYRVDLSQVVSKYIGETEKNLRGVFDAAERSGAVLVIDEADALFGQRSEVKDSHDRYANIEVSYLLQRMESYRGLAVLTTNLRANIDDAFVRRLGFIVTFPFPDEPQRRDLWRRAFGPRVPVCDLDAARLAQLNLAGGSIRNVAVHAAFRAAERAGAVTMADVLAGARSEYEKLDRPLTSTELQGWQQ
jgi:hypothetical protein